MKLAFTTCTVGLAALLTFATSFASAGETVYRWKDQAGNQVNSDRPPPDGIEYETISTSSSMVHTVESTAVPASEQAEPEDGKAVEQLDDSKPKVEKNPEYCQSAKDNLAALDSNVRIRMRDEKGEVRYLSEEERATEKQKALDAIKAFCD